ncbi:MAG: alpha/beta fold hydrolase [Marmoricola sp.]
MEIQRGLAGVVPYASVGAGRPVLVCAGLWPATGVSSDRLVRGAIAPLRKATGRRLVVVNRRSHMPAGFTMEQLVAEYADAVRSEFGGPVDVLGTSTGGSIAQQLAAQHPDVVRRLVLVSTAWRLEGEARTSQAELAAYIRAGRHRAAAAAMGVDAAPPGFRRVTRGVFWLVGSRVFPHTQVADDLATTLEAEDAFDLSRCPEIQAPTLIVGGGRDRWYTVEQFTRTAALIPGSRLHVEPRLGHLSVTTSPRVQATIAAFLDEPDPTPTT